MNSPDRSRSAGIDAVRVLGIAAVIFGHVYTGPLTHQFLYAWHVPLFFFITGYLWTRGRSIGAELDKRGRTLGLPYVGWFLVITLLLVIDMARQGAGINLAVFLGPAMGGLSATGPYGTFWFVSVLFFTAVLHRAIEPLPRPAVWLIAALGLVVGYLHGPWLAATPLAIGSALPCLAFVVIGTIARDIESRIPARPWVGGALVVVPLVIIGFKHPAEINIKQGLYGAPLSGVLFACAISFGLLLLAKAIPLPGLLGSLATDFAVVGIAVVLFHTCVIAYGRSWGMAPIVLLGAALLIPWVAALALHRTPASGLLIGAPRRQRRRVPRPA